MEKLNHRILYFLDKIGFTPLCEIGCEYEDKCMAEEDNGGWDKCKLLDEITRKFKKVFPEIKG